MAEWSWVETDAAECFCQIQYFGITKMQAQGGVEFIISVREYKHAPDPALKFFAQADKQTNQKTMPFAPTGWGSTLVEALWECIREVRRFPYEPS